MQRLYKSEIRQAQNNKKKFQMQKNAILYSLTPLKDILRGYNELTHRGFNSEATVNTLIHLSQAIRARGYKARVQGDYSAAELDQSWRLQKLVEDLQFGLRQDQFFSAEHLAQSSLGLADLGYKDTQLIPKVFEKLNAQLDERQLGVSLEQKSLNFNQAIYGGFKGFVDRHYVFKGFQNSSEFNEYLSILLEWENTSPSEKQAPTQTQLSEQAQDLQRSMADIIQAAVQVKELQKEHQASIDNLRQQFFLMNEAADKHAFLQENQYIKYDLLELQELLVKGGYLEPEEANNLLAHEPFEQRMQRAADVFYDYVVNYAPEVLSPQHNNFYQAAVTAQEAAANIKPEVNYLAEEQNLLSLKTLSQTLVGLSEQSLSFRRDVHKRDYLHSFYEDYLLPLEKRIFSNEPRDMDRFVKSEIVMMERAYLRPWKLFKTESARILPRMADLIKEESENVEGQLEALRALAAMRVEANEMRRDIIGNSNRVLGKGQEIEGRTALAGLKGLAEGPTMDDKAKELARRLESKIDIESMTFSDKLDAIWSLCALQIYDSKSLAQGLTYLNSLKFERLDNELKYSEYQKLQDIHNAIKFEAPKQYFLEFNNKGLIEGLSLSDQFLIQKYEEHGTKFDPFKQRVVQALSKGLTNASVDHQIILENELYQTQTLDTDILNKERYPYKPDILMGYKGQKVGIFVLPETSTTRDTHQADGAYQFRMRILEKAQGLKAIAIAVDLVVNYDIEAMSLQINPEFKFKQILDSVVQPSSQQRQIDFTALSDFGGRFVSQAADFIKKLDSPKQAEKMDALIQRLYQLLVMKQQNELRFEPQQRAAGYDELRFQAMKISLLYDSLNAECKTFVDSFALLSSSDFKALLMGTVASIPKNLDQTNIADGLDNNWLGTRLEVELPVSGQSVKKSLAPELINQRFMWVEDYFHYDDWKAKQQATFDHFNLLVLPSPNEKQDKFFYDKDLHHRRVPQGVFPYPNHKRQLMLPSADHNLTQMIKGGHDDFVLFEKEPYKMMVLQELKKAETLKPIDDDTSFITNLQNVKQGLKSDYSDYEILNTILLNMNFTEQLIEEHLKLIKQNNSIAKGKETKYLQRDPTKFRRFVESTYYSKDREDPYTHFYLKEAKGKEAIKKLIQEEKELRENIEEESKDLELIRQGEKRRQALQDKIEDLLLREEQVNQDLLDLSSSLKTHVQVLYDLGSLIKSEFIYDVDPDLVDQTLTDEEYMDLYRRRAEAKMIKSKIIYKVQQDQELSQLERQYLKAWAQEITEGKGKNIDNLRETMVPKEATKMRIGDVEAKSLYALNSISKVSIEREKHGQYSLSDLVVELSHFIDEEVVNKVETEMFSEKLRKDWGLSKDFKIVETRNKEIGLVLNEMEELAWRSAGQLNEKDFEHLKAMLSVKRNKDYFDKHFYDNDMSSFRHFFEAVNAYDNRQALIERWIVRKEDELKSRAVRPTAELAKPDQELHKQIDAPLKRARERLAAKLLIADEFGNPIDKEYKDLTSRELHSLTENLSLRLYLFNYEYPLFLPQVVKAVMEHPNLLKSDRDQLDLYCKMFELDWRADRNFQNKQEFMSTNPIYIEGPNVKSYGEVTEEVVKDRLKKACAPYVEETAKKIIQQASQ